MGVRNSTTERYSCLVDSVSMTAFGPIFDSEGELDDYLEYLDDVDPRRMTPAELETSVEDWRTLPASETITT